MVDDLMTFLANPTPEGARRAADEQSFILRVGVLFGGGHITAGQARRMLAERGAHGVTILDGLPEHYCPKRRSP